MNKKVYSWDFKITYPNGYTISKSETEMAPITTILQISNTKGSQIDFTKRLLGDPEDLSAYQSTKNALVYEKKNATTGQDGRMRKEYLVRISPNQEYFVEMRYNAQEGVAERELIDIVTSVTK